MVDRRVDVLLIGGGVASAACARELRDQGFEGSILLAGRESDPPYARPPASKEYLRGQVVREEALYLDEDWYGEHDVELLTRSMVMRLDVQAREAKLAKGTVGYGQALVATGANVRRLPLEGDELDGIHYLRALANADALREDVAGVDRVVMIGGSYIGCEVAASLTTLGKSCTVVLQESAPLAHHFGERAGQAVGRVLAGHGVELVPEASVERLEGRDGRVGAVVLSDGRTIEAEAVVVGVGAMPDVMLARAAGLDLGERGGVACSARLETSAPDVWAAGDVCQYESAMHDGPIRVEHHEHAIAQGRTAARNMLGAGAAHEEVPYFWSDLADWLTVESVGPPVGGWDVEAVRGDLEAEAWTVFLLREGRLRGALTAGRPQDLDVARELLRSGERVEPAELERSD